MVEIVMLVLQTLNNKEGGLMEDDKNETWKRLKKPFLTTEQKMDIIRECNLKLRNDLRNELLNELTKQARNKK